MICKMLCISWNSVEKLLLYNFLIKIKIKRERERKKSKHIHSHYGMLQTNDADDDEDDENGTINSHKLIAHQFVLSTKWLAQTIFM